MEQVSSKHHGLVVKHPVDTLFRHPHDLYLMEQVRFSFNPSNPYSCPHLLRNNAQFNRATVSRSIFSAFQRTAILCQRRPSTKPAAAAPLICCLHADKVSEARQSNLLSKIFLFNPQYQLIKHVLFTGTFYQFSIKTVLLIIINTV